MSGRLSKSRQQPLGPDETFSALVTRLIMTNREERARRDQNGAGNRLALPKARSDSRGEPRSGTGAA
jgi:hypothetical protein